MLSRLSWTEVGQPLIVVLTSQSDCTGPGRTGQEEVSEGTRRAPASGGRPVFSFRFLARRAPRRPAVVEVRMPTTVNGIGTAICKASGNVGWNSYDAVECFV